MNSLILRTACGVLLPIILLFSIVILLRGHNEPGGGFVGGLLAAAAFALYSMGFGPEDTRRLIGIDLHKIVGVGVGLAALSGAPGLIGGHAYLESMWLTVPVVGLGELKVGTPLLFDIGVYLTVVGVTLVMILTLEER